MFNLMAMLFNTFVCGYMYNAKDAFRKNDSMGTFYFLLLANITVGIVNMWFFLKWVITL